MKKYFITGTDTDVGKSVVSSLLTMALNAHYWKPIQSGMPDSLQVKQWTGLPEDRFYPSVYSLKASLSPDQAARLEGISIDSSKCILPDTNKMLIVEGAGGVYTPLNQYECMMDLMKKFDIPAIIVARGTLGTINHTLLTIEALRHRQIPIRGIVFNGELNPDSQAKIEDWGKVKTLFHVPRFQEINTEILQLWIKQRNKITEAKIHDYLTT